MNLAQIQLDIRTVAAQIVADFSDYPLVVEIDNRKTVDQATQDKPYLKLEIDTLPGGGQLDIGKQVTVRQFGQLCLYAVDRAGNGTARAAALLDFAVPYLSRKVCGGVHFHAGQATRGKDIGGWWHQPCVLDFWSDHQEG